MCDVYVGNCHIGLTVTVTTVTTVHTKCHLTEFTEFNNSQAIPYQSINQSFICLNTDITEKTTQ